MITKAHLLNVGILYFISCYNLIITTIHILTVFEAEPVTRGLYLISTYRYDLTNNDMIL